MTSIDVAVLEFTEGGRAIWVHNSHGSTVIRIQCTGKVKIHKGCENICAHSDINVVGDIEICIPDEPEPSMTTPTPDEIYRGYLRYEFVRTLSPYRFSELFQRHHETGKGFDSLVDEAMSGIKGMDYRLYLMQNVNTHQVKNEQ